MTESAPAATADALLVQLARHVCNAQTASDLAHDQARACLMDSLAYAFQSLQQPACVQRLGPTVPGATFPGGARVPGTSLELEPVQAAYNIGLLLRGFAADDGTLAGGIGHPSDSLGALLAIADYRARQAILTGGVPPTMRDVLAAMIKAHEIQAALVFDKSPDRCELGPLLGLRIAATAVATAMSGGTEDQVVNALSNAFLDGVALHGWFAVPHDPARRSRAVGDACSRAVRHALMAVAGETACTVVLKGDSIRIDRKLGSTRMENPMHRLDPASLQARYAESVAALYPPKQQPLVQGLFADPAKLDAMPVQQFMAALVRNG